MSKYRSTGPNTASTMLKRSAPNVPLFLAEVRSDVVRLTEPPDECETDLWLLTHPESRHLRLVAAVYSHLAQAMNMP